MNLTDRMFDTDFKTIHIGWIVPKKQANIKHDVVVWTVENSYVSSFERNLPELKDKLMSQIERLGQKLPK